MTTAASNSDDPNEIPDHGKEEKEGPVPQPSDELRDNFRELSKMIGKGAGFETGKEGMKMFLNFLKDNIF